MWDVQVEILQELWSGEAGTFYGTENMGGEMGYVYNTINNKKIPLKMKRKYGRHIHTHQAT